MIHDAIVQVTCDRERCRESVFVGLEWVYHSLHESSGFYDYDDSKTETQLRDEHEWIVCDGKHYCTSECAAIEACPTAFPT